MKKKNIFKFELPETRFSSILDDHLKGIKTLIGDFKIVDIKQRHNGNIKIWVVPTGDK